MAAPPGPRPARAGPLVRLGRRARRVLAGVLLAVSGGLLARSVLLLAAVVLGGDEETAGVGIRVLGVAVQLVVVLLALSLWRRANRALDEDRPPGAGERPAR